MKLYSVRGGNKEELKNRQYNIGVGISLGNKWFTVENIVELVKWSLQYTRENVIVYVADSIHAINLEVRNRISYEKALEKTDKMGSDILEAVRIELSKQLTEEDYEKTVYVKWDDLVDDSFTNKVEYLKSLYSNNIDFKKSIHSIVESFVQKEQRNFSKEDINRFGDYIIQEMPEVINRVKMKGIICDAYTYPYDGELTRLVERIQEGKIFPEIIENIMDTEPKVFLEVR